MFLSIFIRQTDIYIHMLFLSLDLLKHTIVQVQVENYAYYESELVIILYHQIRNCSPITNINNINKTRAFLQTTGGKDEPNIVFMLIS